MQESRDIRSRARSFGALEGSARGPRNVRLRLEKIADLVSLKGDRLLDIGCGNGAYTRVLAEGFERVDAIDVELARLNAFRGSNAAANVTIREMSADSMEFESNAFGAVTAIEVLEHVADVEMVLAEVSRVLRPGGWFALTTPNRLWPLEQHGYLLGGRRRPGWTAPGLVWMPWLHRRVSDADAFSVRRLKKLLEGAGLRPLGHRYLFPPLDRLQDGHFVHEVLGRLERSPVRVFGQTLIMAATKLRG